MCTPCSPHLRRERRHVRTLGAESGDWSGGDRLRSVSEAVRVWALAAAGGRGGRRRLDCRAGVRGEGELRGRTVSFLLRRMGGLPPWPFSASDNREGMFQEASFHRKGALVSVSSQNWRFRAAQMHGGRSKRIINNYYSTWFGG